MNNPYESPQGVDLSYTDGTLVRPIQMQGSMPVRDVLYGQLLILSRRWGYALLCLGLYVAFVLALGLLTPSSSLFGNTFMVLGLFVMPAILPLTLLLVHLRLVRAAQKKVGIFAVTETNLTNDGITSSVNKETTSIPWSSFRSFLGSSQVIVLFLQNSNNHLIISRSKLKRPEDWSMLLEFLDNRLPRH